ncbi:predicted protein [Postia placenta Mad-698-R]|uniref:Uncharacterized protein n=1 Tax=Postia placenta MAD-698-R-SB12 TaxID=670580 RepID=A0A1X6N3Z8_9APHY|nr:hypothetical protein POSPLADRAFT_1045694 [Postia placenta MAD-698-R-SB12]EED79758.1 predicted protein [Postia placenta Mad-698-R]OSX63347.1 hypothetical protein POSPLADRAFT_1045694 [Postia placenta MAD-698-R-SB12]
MSSPRLSTRPLSLSGPRPLQLVDGNVPASASPSTSSCPSPTISGLSTPPPTARSIKASRRQSSISYFPSDNAPTWDLRSPTIVAAPSLKRSLSLGPKANGTPGGKGDRRSLGSVDVQSPKADRGPLTLTEKHADLLQFIAQKESKCLELRSQLAMHEAELAELKRKWERIVSRGMDRMSMPSPLTSPNGGALEGIKEGVRLLASGLGDLSSPTSVSASPASPVPVQVLPGLASVSRSTMGRVRGHTNTQSTSSVSTTGTSTSSHTTSTRLSQSSASSLAFDEPLLEVDEKREGSPHGSVEVSPSSALRAAKLHRRKSREQPSPLCSPLADTSATLGADSPRTRAMKRSSLNLSSGLPPPAIPGIGVLAGQPMSSWMETMGSSVGRKWEELQKGETFTKSQKRASVILSDVSQTFFSALTSPGPSSGTFVSVSSNPFAATLSPLSTSPSASTPPPMMASSASTHSLLDDDSEAQGLGSVMVPDSKGSSSSTSSRTPSVNTKDQSDDEWNW